MHEDSELLRLYTETRSEAAFTALVQRHLPLVYSAALRQVGGDIHRAQEVAQTVFTLLARKAVELRRHPALSGWLYTTAYYTAAKTRRAEQRRWRREQESQAMHDPNECHPAPVDWEQLRPVIDEMMLQLKESDRTAVLLRFFENRSYGEIGAQLGLNENAARMRLDRALDALRAALAGRGIVSTAAALGGALSSHAVATPTAGLVAAISAGATATAAAATTIGGGLAFFMNSTILKTGLLTAVIVTGTAGLVFQHRENVRLQDEVRLLRAQAGKTSSPGKKKSLPPTAAPSERNTEAELARLRAELAELKRNPENSVQERIVRLRQLLEKAPELGIPEIQLASEEDWIEAAKGKLETETDYRRALATLRNTVIRKFAMTMQPALVQFLKNNAEKFPTDASQLQPYFESPVDSAIWQRYEVVPAFTVSNVGMGGDWIITQKDPVDSEFDQKFVMGPRGYGSTSYGTFTDKHTLATVVNAFAAANPGQTASNPAQLLPYATTPEQRKLLQKVIDDHSRMK